MKQVQTDFEDFLEAHEQTHGLGMLPPTALPTSPRGHRTRTPRLIQTDIEEFIADNKAASSVVVDPAQPVIVPDFGTEDRQQQPAQPVQRDAVRSAGSSKTNAKAGVHTSGCGIGTEDHSLKFLKEAVHIQKEPKPPAQHDYRHLLRFIQAMLSPDKEEEKGPAVCACGHARKRAVPVHLIKRENGTERASVTGIFRCGNGEACPHCARQVAALRARRYRLMHSATTARGGKVVTFVLTIAHDLDDRLSILLKALKTAATRSRGDRLWNDEIAPLMQAVGAMTDTHVRLSRRAGWHPHLHVSIACLTDDMEALKTGASMLLDSYIAKLAALGYRAAKAQQSATILDAKPNAYPAHHHRRAEVTGKLADAMDDDTSLSPFDIAELAADGDVEMQNYFREFVEAVRGQKSGVITARMAKKLGIEPGTDPGPTFDETTRLGTIPATVWTKLLDLNLTGTFLDHVETFGRAGWQRSRWWALQQTGFAPHIDVAMADEMMSAMKAITMLPDPEAKRIGQNFLDSRIKVWTDRHGRKLVVATLSYANAHAPFALHCNAAAEDMAAVLETWAAKAALRRRHAASHTTLPACDGPPRPETVPHGSNSERVGQNTPISQQA